MKMHLPGTMAFFRGTGGAAAIEFAIVGNVFILLLIGTAYVSVMLWHAANLDWAVEAGSRVAAINSSATQTDVSTAVNNYLSSVGMRGHHRLHGHDDGRGQGRADQRLEDGDVQRPTAQQLPHHVPLQRERAVAVRQSQQLSDDAHGRRTPPGAGADRCRHAMRFCPLAAPRPAYRH